MTTIIVPGDASTSGSTDPQRIVNILTRAARQCSVSQPSSWVSATEDKYEEFRDDFLLDTADDILERIDLPSPIGKQTTLATDGSESYILPTDFKRMQRDQMAVYDSLLNMHAIPITSDGDWTFLKDIGTSGTARFYRITGYDENYEISLYNLPSATANITVSYISKSWIVSSAGLQRSDFTDSEDYCLLPWRIMVAGIVWRWRERKGLPYNDKYMEYEAMLTRLSNDSRSRRVINFGGHDHHIKWQDLVPAYIPPGS